MNSPSKISNALYWREENPEPAANP